MQAEGRTSGFSCACVALFAEGRMNCKAKIESERGAFVALFLVKMSSICGLAIRLEVWQYEHSKERKTRLQSQK